MSDRAWFDERLGELEAERDALRRERDELRARVRALESRPAAPFEFVGGVDFARRPDRTVVIAIDPPLDAIERALLRVAHPRVDASLPLLMPHPFPPVFLQFPPLTPATSSPPRAPLGDGFASVDATAQRLQLEAAARDELDVE